MVCIYHVYVCMNLEQYMAEPYPYQMLSYIWANITSYVHFPRNIWQQIINHFECQTNDGGICCVTQSIALPDYCGQ